MQSILYSTLFFTVCIFTEISPIGGKKATKHTDSKNSSDTNSPELDTRFYLQNLPNYDCYTRLRDPGRCVSLKDCPVLRERVRNYDRMYILQAVSDYICGFESTVKVCCPDNASWGRPEGTNLAYNPGGGWSQPVRPSRPQQLPNTWETPNQPTSRPERPTGNPNNVWAQPFDDEDENNQWGRPNPPTDSRPNQPVWPLPSDNRPNRPPSNRPQGGNDDRKPSQFPSETSEDPTTTTLRTPPNDNSNQGSSDTTNHRNRKMLPTNCGADVMANKVLFGNDTALGEYPWVALVRIRTPGGATFHGCGGSLIHPRYVLTAAHCVEIADVPSAKVDQVRLGEHDTRADPDCEGAGEFRECSGSPQNIDVEQQIVHSGYVASSRGQTDDIALLRLKRPAVLSKFVMPICLPMDDIGRMNYDQKSLWVAGWGRTSNDPNSNSPIKQKVSLPVVPDSKCKTIYKNSAYKLDLADTQMCAGGGQADSCRGDSGGPLMSLDQAGPTFRWHVQGVVSIGPNKCGTVGMPGIYTRVSGYIPWILDNIRE